MCTNKVILIFLVEHDNVIRFSKFSLIKYSSKIFEILSLKVTSGRVLKSEIDNVKINYNF